MKKTLKLLLLFLLVIPFISCSSDDKENPKDSIVGTWRYEDAPYSDVWFLTLNENGTYLENDNGNIRSGYYLIERNLLILGNIEDEPITYDSYVCSYTILSLSSEKMVLRMEGDRRYGKDHWPIEGDFYSDECYFDFYRVK